MKNIFYILIIVSLVSACKSNSSTSTSNNALQGFSNEAFKTSGDTAWYQSTENADLVRILISRKTGEKRKEYFEKNGVLDGKLTYWFSNGTVEREGTYSNGEKVGEWNEYYYYKNNLAKSEFFDNGKNENMVTEYHSNGNKKLESTYKNGEKNGPSKEWWENGTIKSDMIFKDDKPQGPAKLYHPNGELNATGHWNQGNRDKTFEFYYDNGQAEKTITYKNGLPHGPITVWKRNGDLLMEGVNENGELIEEKTY